VDLSRTVTEVNGDFSRKSQVPPVYFALPLKEFQSELGIGAGVKKTRMMGLPGRTKSLTISSAVWIQSSNVTDRQTDTGRQQRPHLRIASCGKNYGRALFCGKFSHVLSNATFNSETIFGFGWNFQKASCIGIGYRLGSPDILSAGGSNFES